MVAIKENRKRTLKYFIHTCTLRLRSVLLSTETIYKYNDSKFQHQHFVGKIKLWQEVKIFSFFF